MIISGSDSGGFTSLGHREQRLLRVKELIITTFLMYEKEGLINNIRQLHDHKGILTVVTFLPPCDLTKEACTKAWEFVNECTIEFSTELING